MTRELQFIGSFIFQFDLFLPDQQSNHLIFWLGLTADVGVWFDVNNLNSKTYKGCIHAARNSLLLTVIFEIEFKSQIHSATQRLF